MGAQKNKVPIKLKTKEDAEEFVRICSHCPYDVDIVQGRMIIDAKSLLGVLSLDLSRTTYAVAHEDGTDFFGRIAQFAREEGVK